MGKGGIALIFLSVSILIHVIPGRIFGAFLEIKKIAFDKKQVNISLKSLFSDVVDVDKIINDGIQLNVTYDISVFKKSGFPLPDELVSRYQIYFKAKKDIINEGFELTEYSRYEEINMWLKDMDELKYFLMNVDDAKLIHTEMLEDSAEYYVETRLTVSSIKLYPPLRFIFNLFGKWNYTSPKIRSRLFTKDGIIQK